MLESHFFAVFEQIGQSNFPIVSELTCTSTKLVLHKSANMSLKPGVIYPSGHGCDALGRALAAMRLSHHRLCPVGGAAATAATAAAPAAAVAAAAVESVVVAVQKPDRAVAVTLVVWAISSL